MASLIMIEVLDVIYRMTENGFIKSNVLRAPRQIDIVARLMVEKPKEWDSENSLKVLVHRRIKELLNEQLIEENEKRYNLTLKGKHYRLSNNSLIRTNYRRNWGEVNIVPGLHASYGINKGYLIDERRDQLVQDKISDFLNELEKMAPEDELDLQLNIHIENRKILSVRARKS